jgi:hypothetical protein
MFVDKKIFRTNRLSVSILFFLIIFALIHYMKPAFIYNDKGGFRQFGIGYKQKTVIPIWIVAIVLAILCYLLVFFLSV